jgi:hypothetical protein
MECRRRRDFCLCPSDSIEGFQYEKRESNKIARLLLGVFPGYLWCKGDSRAEQLRDNGVKEIL